MDSFGDEIERRFTRSVCGFRLFKHVGNLPDETGNGDEFPSLSFQEEWVQGLEQDKRSDCVDLEMLDQRLGGDFNNFILVFGDASIGNDDVEPAGNLANRLRCLFGISGGRGIQFDAMNVRILGSDFGEFVCF